VTYSYGHVARVRRHARVRCTPRCLKIHINWVYRFENEQFDAKRVDNGYVLGLGCIDYAAYPFGTHRPPTRSSHARNHAIVNSIVLLRVFDYVTVRESRLENR